MQQRSSRGVQQHEVDDAADALLAEGARPTVERVRGKLGRGSPNTVGPMLEVWFSKLAQRLGVAVDDADGHPSAPAAVRQATEALWELALRLAHEQANALLTSERAGLAGERDELAAARRDLDGQLAAAREREALLQQAQEQARRHADERGAELRDARGLLQQRTDELDQARASIADLVGQKDAAAREHAKQLQAHASERAQLHERSSATEQRLLEEVDRVRQELKAAHKALAAADARTAAMRDEALRERERLTRAANELQVERARLAERLELAQRQAKLPSPPSAKPTGKAARKAIKSPARLRA